MNKYQYAILLVLCVLIISTGWGQQRSQRPQPGQENVVTFETITLPTEANDLIKLDINYRIMKNFFIFTKSSATGAEYDYEGGFELSIEIFNIQGQSSAREITQQTVYNDAPTIEFPDIEYVEGGFSFELPPAEYRLLIRLLDRNSQRRYIDRDRRIELPAYADTNTAIFDIIVIEPVTSDTGTTVFRPVNLGGDIFFSEDADVLIPFISTSEPESIPTITASLHRLSPKGNTGEEVFSKTISPGHIYSGTTIGKVNSDNVLQYKKVDTDREDLYTALFSMNGHTLEEGLYRLSIQLKNENGTAEKSKTFSVAWVDKPASLHNIDFAIEMLEYVMSPDEYRQIRRGSSDEKRRKLIEYWKDKDPEPESAFNPVMTEFYRRVDYAAREFTSLRERNGAQTDRGKVYIIYGPPTRKNRELAPGQVPQEIWVYQHLNQKFIFVDQSRQGNYRLITREEL